MLSRREFATGIAAAAATSLNKSDAQPASVPGIGFIGVGARSRAHFKAYKQLPEAHVVAICDVRKEQMEATNSQLPSKAAEYIDYRELIHDKNVGVVVIATPNFLHCEMAVAALRAGKDVLLEKPMGINYQQAKEIEDAARQNHRVLALGIQRLYGSDGVLIHLIQSGAIGNVKVINASEYRGDWNPNVWTFTDPVTGKSGNWRFMKRAAGSAELEFSVHLYAALSKIIQSPLVRLTSTGGNFYYKNRETRDASSTIVEFKNGMRLSHDYVMFSPCPTVVNLFGDKGSVSRVKGTLSLHDEKGKPRELPPLNKPSEPEEVLLYKDFFNCIRTRGTPLASPELAMEAEKIAFGLDISITQNRTVTAADFA